MVRQMRLAYGIALGVFPLSLHPAAAPLAHARRHVFLGARSEGATAFQAVAVTPDGSQAYAAAGSADVLLFDRDPLTGALTFVGPEAVGSGIGAAIHVSPDGAHVYWLGLGQIRGFSRDPMTGDLTLVNELDTFDAPGLTTSRAFAISPDGANLYVTGEHFGAIVVLARNPTTGALSLVETHQDGMAGVDGMAGAWGVVVSPDGAHVYVAGHDDDAVAVFARSAIDGTLTFLGAVTNPLLTLNVVKAVDVSPDGAQVYTGGIGELGMFARDSGSGMLTFVQSDTPGFLVVQDLAVGPDGLHVFAADDSGILYAWARDPSTGEVSLEDASPVRLLGYLHEFPSLAVSPDSRNVYVADEQFGDEPSSVMTFRRVEVACSEAPLSPCLGLSPSGKSKLLIRDNSDDNGDRLTWKWIEPTPPAPPDFGDPVTTLNDYALCVYDASGSPQPLSAPLAPAAGGCDAEEGGLTPCWTALPGVGFRYRQPTRVPDGTMPVKLLIAGSGVKSLFKSKGEHVPVPALPLTLPVTVQLQNAEGSCWEATYDTSILNDDDTFKAVAD